MTRDEILTATPEWLNEQAARKAYNFTVKQAHHMVKAGWNPAGDIKDAMKLADLMHKNGDYLSLEYQAGVFPEICNKLGWAARFRRAWVYASGETAPEAITKAFLLAMMDEAKPIALSPADDRDELEKGPVFQKWYEELKNSDPGD